MRTRTLIFFLTLLLSIILIIQPVSGVGIGQYTNQKTTLFQPGLQKIYTFYLYDNTNIAASLEGDLAEYCIIKDPDPNGGPRNIEVIINFPEYLEPGTHTVALVAIQAFADASASVGGIAQVRTSMSIYALYPGIRPEFQGITSNDLNINEKSTIKIQLLNMGEEYINSANGIITIYDKNNNTVAILNTDTKSVGPFESQTLTAILDATIYNMTVGEYRAVGRLICDDETVDKTMESNFIVGELKVDIIDTTPSIIVNATNKYYITLESDWSGDITDVYVRITMPNGKVLKSPNVDLIKPSQGRKAAGQIEMYLETEDIPIGSYDVDVTTYYKGQTSIKKIKLNIVDGKAPEIEKPKLITTKTIFIGMGVLIVLFVALYFLVFKRGGNSGDNSKSYSNNASTKSSDNDIIKPPSL